MAEVYEVASALGDPGSVSQPSGDRTDRVRTVSGRTSPLRRRPSGRLGRPPDTDGEQTRRQLILVARQHFAERGYSDATLKDIAASLGVTAGAVYYYYPSKTELFIAVADDMMVGWQETMREQVDPGAPFRVQLRDALEALALLHLRNPTMSAFMLTLDLEGARHPELRDARRRSLEVRDGFFRALVDAALARREFRPGITAEAVADVVASLRLGMARFSGTTASVRRHRAMIAALAAIIDGTLFDDHALNP